MEGELEENGEHTRITAEQVAAVVESIDRKLEEEPNNKQLKKKANKNLCSEIGQKLRSQRVVEVEQTFGRIKGWWSFRRFLLRGKEKVKIEWGLLSIAHNITKLALER